MDCFAFLIEWFRKETIAIIAQVFIKVNIYEHASQSYELFALTKTKGGKRKFFAKVHHVTNNH